MARTGRAFPIRPHLGALVMPPVNPPRAPAFIVHSPRRLRARPIRPHLAPSIVGAAVVHAPVQTIAFIVHPLSQRRQWVRVRPHLAPIIVRAAANITGATFTSGSWSTAYAISGSWDTAYSISGTWDAE